MLDERRPVPDCGRELPDVDKIKVGGEIPGLGEVVDLEGNIGVGVGGLYGGEVNTEDGGGRMLVAEVKSPDTGSGAAV